MDAVGRRFYEEAGRLEKGQQGMFRVDEGSETCAVSMRVVEGRDGPSQASDISAVVQARKEQPFE